MMAIVNVGYDSTNYYVLGQGRQRLLVDVGWPNTLPKLLFTLKRKDIPLEHIGYLLATHYHPDHAGLAQELKARGVRLVVIDLQRPFIPLLRRVMKPDHRFVDIALHDNTEIACEASRAFLSTLGIAGDIVHTPGHSDDSVSLVLDEGVAFTGDLTSPFAIDDTIAERVLASWALLRGKGVRSVYPGHGPSPRPIPPPSGHDGLPVV